MNHSLNIIFRCGSIISTYDLVFDSAQVPTTSQLTQTLQDALNSGFIETSRYQLDINSISYQGTSVSNGSHVNLLVDERSYAIFLPTSWLEKLHIMCVCRWFKWQVSRQHQNSGDFWINLWLRGDQRDRLHVNWWTWIKFKKNTKNWISLPIFSQTVFKICLYARHFDSSLSPHKIFRRHFINSSKLLKNHLITEFLNEVKSSSFFQKFRRIDKVPSENFVWTYWWIKTSSI